MKMPKYPKGLKARLHKLERKEEQLQKRKKRLAEIDRDKKRVEALRHKLSR